MREERQKAEAHRKKSKEKDEVIAKLFLQKSAVEQELDTMKLKLTKLSKQASEQPAGASGEVKELRQQVR